jgi:hypothetical protein
MPAKFSPSDAAVSIFSFAKANRPFTLRYMGIYGIIGLISVFGLIGTGYLDVMTRIAEITRRSTQPNPDTLLAAFALIKVPQLAVFLIVSTLVSLVMLGMALRKTVLNKEIGFYGLNWGRDENQLGIALLQLWLVFFLGYIVVVLIGGLIAMAVPGFLFIIPVVLILFFVFLLGRFGMYGVYTVANQKASLRQTADATKEQFWSFVGAFFLAWIIVAIGAMVIQAIIGLILKPLMGQIGASGFPANVSDMLNIGSILYFFINGAISGLSQLALVCVGAFAYHKMSESVSSTTINDNQGV